MAQKVEEMVAPLRLQVEASTKKAEAERLRADEYLLQTHVTEAFTKAGGQGKATDFIVSLAKNHFEVKDGKVVAKTGQFSKDKPGDALSVKEWLKKTAEEHDYA